jgi:hypothetical protein
LVRSTGAVVDELDAGAPVLVGLVELVGEALLVEPPHAPRPSPSASARARVGGVRRE